MIYFPHSQGIVNSGCEYIPGVGSGNPANLLSLLSSSSLVLVLEHCCYILTLTVLYNLPVSLSLVLTLSLYALHNRTFHAPLIIIPTKRE